MRQIGSRGLSLVELLAAMAVSVVLILGIAQFAQVTEQQSREMRAQAEFRNLEGLIQQLLSSKEACTTALGTKSPVNGNPLSLDAPGLNLDNLAAGSNFGMLQVVSFTLEDVRTSSRIRGGSELSANVRIVVRDRDGGTNRTYTKNIPITSTGALDQTGNLVGIGECFTSFSPGVSPGCPTDANFLGTTNPHPEKCAEQRLVVTDDLTVNPQQFMIYVKNDLKITGDAYIADATATVKANGFEACWEDGYNCTLNGQSGAMEPFVGCAWYPTAAATTLTFPSTTATLSCPAGWVQFGYRYQRIGSINGWNLVTKGIAADRDSFTFSVNRMFEPVTTPWFQVRLRVRCCRPNQMMVPIEPEVPPVVF